MLFVALFDITKWVSLQVCRLPIANSITKINFFLFLFFCFLFSDDHHKGAALSGVWFKGGLHSQRNKQNKLPFAKCCVWASQQQARGSSLGETPPTGTIVWQEAETTPRRRCFSSTPHSYTPISFSPSRSFSLFHLNLHQIRSAL